MDGRRLGCKVHVGKGIMLGCAPKVADVGNGNVPCVGDGSSDIVGAPEMNGGCKLVGAVLSWCSRVGLVG